MQGQIRGLYSVDIKGSLLCSDHMVPDADNLHRSVEVRGVPLQWAADLLFTSVEI